LAHADPDDANKDGISGKPNQVWSREQDDVMLGRFGWKAGVPTITQQAAEAFVGDIGLSTRLIPFGSGDCTEKEKDCLDAPNGNSPRYQNVEVGDDLFKMVSPSTHGTSRCPRAARVSDLNNGCGLAPTHQQANFLLTSGEGWLATADSSGGMECPASSFQWDNDAILVRLKPRFCQFRAGF
jgi:hypothetical protein